MKKFSQTAFSRFFVKFPKLLLAGALYSISLDLFTGVFVLVSYLTGFNNVIVWGLGIIPSMPFLAGLTMVVRKYAVEKEDVKVVSTFFTTVRDNFLKFLVHGVVAYLITACSFFALLYYYTLSKVDVVFGSVLTLYLIFTLLLIVMMYYVPIMTITYELKMKDIYKNAFLLIFGKILRNLIATVCIAVVSAAALLLLIFSKGIFFGVSVALVTLLFPLIAVYIVVAIISGGLQDAVGKFVGVKDETEPDEFDAAHLNEVISNTGNNSDYVFVNGKMIKVKKEQDKSD